MATHTVTAPLVIAKTPTGSDQYVYKGGQVPDGQSDEWIEFHTTAGMIAEADQPEPEAPASKRRSKRGSADTPPGDTDAASDAETGE